MKKVVRMLCLVLGLAMMLIIVGCGSVGGGTPNGNKPAGDGGAQSGNKPDVNVITYTIKWVDENGETLFTDTVEEGKIPSYSYSVSDTAEWDYTFNGWADTENGEVLQSIPTASKNATYYAIVSRVKQKYTVVFNSNGGSEVQSQTLEYGEKATVPEQPTYEGYRFVGWHTNASGSSEVDFNEEITSNKVYYAKWNKVVDIKRLLQTLLNGYHLNPFQYIPESMTHMYSDNLVDTDDIIDNYSSFVNVSEIKYGFGEQWNMVIDNLAQSQTFFNVLSVVDTISSSSITIFNNYFDKNPSDVANYKFKDGIYNVTINFDGETISYVLDYTATLPVLGEQTIQLALSMNVDSGEKVVRIQLGDANALTYKVSENSYEFAIKYLGVRRAMFTIELQDDGTVEGKIYEYLTVSAVEIASCADFYITDDYVSVIGNKADGMVGFTGYISELYDAESGNLIGYEVQETLSAITYNTIWLNLNEVDGITSIKFKEETEETEAQIFINRLSTAWQTKKVGGISLKTTSRRFDIEFRTQYVYSYDDSTKEYVKNKISVPMIFVQEENYDTFTSDVKEKNNVNISVNVLDSDLEKMLDDYDTFIPMFIETKDNIKPENIIEYIGEKVIF